MEVLVQARIEAEAQKKLQKWRDANAVRFRKFERFQKKTGFMGPYLPLPQPIAWSRSPQFNPIYCISRARYLAKTIVRKVRAGTYDLQPASRVEILKENGTFREIDCFSIPDTALCTLLSESIRDRNDKTFSAFSYAYRNGSKPLDAVIRLKNFIHAEKVFISKYDFQNYFGSVSHDYIERNILQTKRFKITSFERTVIRALLRHQIAMPDGSMRRREIGFPQGNSLSLFLANAVGDHLDASLDKKNGNYIRYADDSVVINYSYEDSIRAIESYSDFSSETGVKINREKESGISIISDRIGEMRTSFGVDFLGYNISKNKIDLSNKAVYKLKKRCARIIYHNLLMYPKKFNYIPSRRFGPFQTDWDLLACLTELRIMLYGDITQNRIERYLSGQARLKNMPGGISYYCLVDRVEIFSKLDGWLLWAIQRAMKKRNSLVSSIHPTIALSNLTNEELITGDWLRAHRKFEGKIPSFVLAWRASRKAFYSHGHLGVNNGTGDYNDL